jgi:hypothetical protein
MDTIPAAAISASGSNYIRFSNGVQICWGHQKISDANYYYLVSLPAAFKDNQYSITTSCDARNNGSGGPYLYPVYNTNGTRNNATDINTTYFTWIRPQEAYTFTNNSYHAYYIAIGLWK